jgi:hypothetical protein
MDVLSEVLKTIKLDGAFFYNAEFTSPWSFREPPSAAVSPHLSPSGEHVIIYHLTRKGDAPPPSREINRLALIPAIS